MLVLTRRPDEVINIYPQEGAVKISVQILGVSGNQVRVGIDAPFGVDIVREEIEGIPRKPKSDVQYVRITVEELERLRLNEKILRIAQETRHVFRHRSDGGLNCQICDNDFDHSIHKR
jgi:carbon storage regulator CsrA